MKISYTNSRGESITFGKPSFRILSIGGLGDVDADNQSQKAPYQDGSTHLDSILEERVIPIELKVYGDDEGDLSANRKRLSTVFNPKTGLGEFKIVIADEIYVVQAVSDFVPKFGTGSENMGAFFHTCQIQITAPNPYWHSSRITEEPAFEPLFEFPFEGEFEMGMQRDQRIIFNDGDALAPIQVEFFGPALNPKIINNSTGEFIKINQQLQENERMMIDTTDSNKSVYFVDSEGNERNVFNWIDLDSTFFKLQIGENDIEYTADSDIQGAVVNISYSKLYTAV